MSEEENRTLVQKIIQSKAAVAALVLALVAVIAFVGPSETSRKISPETGRHYVVKKIWGIQVSDGPKETEVSTWITAQGLTPPRETWLDWESTVKPTLGSARTTTPISAAAANSADKFLQALYKADNSKELLTEYYAHLEAMRPTEELASTYSGKKEMKKRAQAYAAFRQKVLGNG